MILEKLGTQLYNQGIIGYCTVELIVTLAPIDPNLVKSNEEYPKTLFWAVDLRQGMTDYMTNFSFCNFIFKNTKNLLKTGLATNINFTKESDQGQTTYFSIPNVIEPEMGEVKMSDIIKIFKSESLVYDINKSSGIVFSFPDLIQCGIFGLSAIGNSQRECLKIISDCINLLKSNVKLQNKFSFLRKIYQIKNTTIRQILFT